MRDPTIEQALKSDNLIDITTTGKKTGSPRRIEIAFHNFDGALYITGLPGKRDWYANLLAQPRFTFHLKQSAHADLPAIATPNSATATSSTTPWRRMVIEVSSVAAITAPTAGAEYIQPSCTGPTPST
jgi:deazaflavin-dependent oxidoreductase (nitroreductase family)